MPRQVILDPRPNHTKINLMIDDFGLDPREVLDALLTFLPDDTIEEFIEDNYAEIIDDIESVEF